MSLTLFSLKSVFPTLLKENFRIWSYHLTLQPIQCHFSYISSQSNRCQNKLKPFSSTYLQLDQNISILCFQKTFSYLYHHCFSCPSQWKIVDIFSTIPQTMFYYMVQSSVVILNDGYNLYAACSSPSIFATYCKDRDINVLT